MVREATSIFSFGVTTIFGNPGSIEPPFFRDVPEEFAYVLGPQEGTVSGMAEGYAQRRAERLKLALWEAREEARRLREELEAYRDGGS